LNDTEPVAFTKSKASLSTQEYESNPNVHEEEEGVGPAVSFEQDGSVSPTEVYFKPLSSSSKIFHIISKASSEAEVKGKKKNSNKKWKKHL